MVAAPAPPPDPEAFALERISSAASEVDSFYADVYDVLTTKQMEIVSPAAYRGHGGLDLVGSGAAWGAVLQPKIYATTEEMIDEVTRSLSFSFNIPERAAEIRPIVEQWTKRITIDAADAQELRGEIRRSRGPGAVRDMLDLLRHIKAELNPPVPDPDRVRLVPVAFVLLRK